MYRKAPRFVDRRSRPGRLAYSETEGNDVRLGGDSRSRRRRWARWSFPNSCSRKPRWRYLPGIGFGQYGDEHVRFALIENEHRTKQAVRKIKRALGKLLD